MYTSTKELSELFGPDIPPEVQNVYVENMRKQSYEQGLGRHSESEINELGLGDLEAISHFLGTLPVWIQDYPYEGRRPFGGEGAPAYNFTKFSEKNCMKLRKMCDVGRHASGAPPRSSIDYIRNIPTQYYLANLGVSKYAQLAILAFLHNF